MKEWETVVYIGEWVGLTGTKSFERKLMEGYVCVKREWIMEWGDDCACVMVWRRRGKGVGVGVNPCVAKGCCGEATIRNVYARREQYCGRACAQTEGERGRREKRMERIGVFRKEEKLVGDWVVLDELRK